MAFKSNDPNVKYYVYLFKQTKYCFRPVTGVDGCPEWRENSELFGCSAEKSDSSPEPEGEAKPTEGDNKEGEDLSDDYSQTEARVENEPGIENCGTSSQKKIIFILFFVFIKMFV